MFDMRCRENGIEHRLTKIRHPWTNGQVERMNRTIKETTVKRYHYESHRLLDSHLHDFINAYNYGRRFKPLKASRRSNTSAKSRHPSPNDSHSIRTIKCRD
jgi:transposase InsO family protein